MTDPMTAATAEMFLRRAEVAEKQARDRDDVIHEIAQHLRAALAVIDRYEDEIHRLASDGEGKR